jgi:hypothetical protein
VGRSDVMIAQDFLAEAARPGVNSKDRMLYRRVAARYLQRSRTNLGTVNGVGALVTVRGG